MQSRVKLTNRHHQSRIPIQSLNANFGNREEDYISGLPQLSNTHSRLFSFAEIQDPLINASSQHNPIKNSYQLTSSYEKQSISDFCEGFIALQTMLEIGTEKYTELQPPNKLTNILMINTWDKTAVSEASKQQQMFELSRNLNKSRLNQQICLRMRKYLNIIDYLSGLASFRETKTNVSQKDMSINKEYLRLNKLAQEQQQLRMNHYSSEKTQTKVLIGERSLEKVNSFKQNQTVRNKSNGLTQVQIDNIHEDRNNNPLYLSARKQKFYQSNFKNIKNQRNCSPFSPSRNFQSSQKIVSEKFENSNTKNYHTRQQMPISINVDLDKNYSSNQEKQAYNKGRNQRQEVTSTGKKQSKSPKLKHSRAHSSHSKIFHKIELKNVEMTNNKKSLPRPQSPATMNNNSQACMNKKPFIKSQNPKKAINKKEDKKKYTISRRMPEIGKITKITNKRQENSIDSFASHNKKSESRSREKSQSLSNSSLNNSRFKSQKIVNKVSAYQSQAVNSGKYSSNIIHRNSKTNKTSNCSHTQKNQERRQLSPHIQKQSKIKQSSPFCQKNHILNSPSSLNNSPHRCHNLKEETIIKSNCFIKMLKIAQQQPKSQEQIKEEQF